LEFLGRIDGQIKIRGYRIEPGEIEAAMRRQAGVREAVVSARGSGADKQLVGYWVREKGSRRSASALKEQLWQSLPEYMRPAALVELEEIPLTRNGKVDRARLPEPERQAEAYSHVGPHTVAEEVMAGIWTEVLRLERVGVEDNFFQLGGHSLLATRLMSRVREAFGIEAPLRELFEHPTVAGLSARLEAHLRAGLGVESEPMLARPRQGDIPLSFAQQRLWFLDQLEPGSSVYNCPTAVRLQGELDVRALSNALNEVVRRHEVLRTTIETEHGKPWQRIAEQASIAMVERDLSGFEPEQGLQVAQQIAAEEARQPFDLAKGPLLRSTLLRLSEQDHVLLLTLHHIVTDGWSMGILLKEVTAIYEAYRNGQASPLPEPELQYADYAIWQREYLRDDVLERHLSYWRTQLSGDLPALVLPTDRPRPVVRTHAAELHEFTIGPEVAQSIAALSRNEGCTPFMVLFAAFQTLIYRYTRQVDLICGADIANRNRAELEPLIGFFVNIILLRTSMDGNPLFRTLLRNVRQAVLNAHAHQDVPFDLLVERLNPERRKTDTPLMRALIVYQRARAAEQTDIAISTFPSSYTTARADLTVFFSDRSTSIDAVLGSRSDLFTSSRAREMGGRYRALLANAVANPDSRIDDLQFESNEERNALRAAVSARESRSAQRLKTIEPVRIR
jgi:acyl carrier protein